MVKIVTLIINPLQINDHELFAQILKVFLLEEIQCGMNCWSNKETFSIPTSLCLEETQFQLSHSLLLRPRNLPSEEGKQKAGYRLETFNSAQEPLAKGAFGSIHQTFGTIMLTDLTVEFHARKSRVIKFFHSNVCKPHHDTITPHIHHLKTKRLVKIKSKGESSQVAMVMKLIPGIRLRHLISESTTEHCIPPEQRRTLTLAVLTAYQTQVTAYNLIHRDIKLDNIMVDMKAPVCPEVFIVDYDEICSWETVDMTRPPSSILSPISEPELVFSPLFPMYRDSEKLERYIGQKKFEDASFTPIIGTYGYIPPEGYATPPNLTLKYDYFALARVIAQIWGIQMHHYGIRDYEKAKADAVSVDYTAKIPKEILPIDESRETIETILTQLSHPNPELRPAIQDVQSFFQRLDFGQKLTCPDVPVACPSN